MSDSSITKETVNQALLDGIHKAIKDGNAKDAKELTAAHCMLEQSELKQTAEADDYAIKCTELEQKDEELKIRDKEIEAHKEAEIQKAVAQKTAAKVGAAFGLIGSVVGAVATVVVVVLTGRNQQKIEDTKVEYGLEFQQRHFDAQKEDDLVTRYSDESFRPR